MKQQIKKPASKSTALVNKISAYANENCSGCNTTFMC